jgi:hypothetical protein
MSAAATVTVKMPMRLVNDLDRLVLERRLESAHGKAVSRSSLINEILASALGSTLKPGSKITSKEY